MTTGEEFEKFMSISEKETYLKTHATIAQLPNAINFVGDHIMGVGPKTDGGFEERMSQIAAAHHHHARWRRACALLQLPQ